MAAEALESDAPAFGALSIPRERPLSDHLCECGCGRFTTYAAETRRSIGRVKGMPNRFVVGHARRRDIPDWVEEDRGYGTPCWVWNRGLGPTGYGRAARMFAHRLVWERLRGPVPQGLQLDHLCRVRSCVNPDHLQVVTQQENIRRGEAGRNFRKLTPRQRYEIMVSTERSSVVERRYGVSHSHVWRLRTGRG